MGVSSAKYGTRVRFYIMNFVYPYVKSIRYWQYGKKRNGKINENVETPENRVNCAYPFFLPSQNKRRSISRECVTQDSPDVLIWSKAHTFLLCTRSPLYISLAIATYNYLLLNIYHWFLSVNRERCLFVFFFLCFFLRTSLVYKLNALDKIYVISFNHCGMENVIRLTICSLMRYFIVLLIHFEISYITFFSIAVLRPRVDLKFWF